MKYRQGKDSDVTIVPFEGVRFVGCCDCGLVHTHIYSVENQRIVERVVRNNRATSNMRRAMAKRGEIVAEHEANVYVIMPRIRRRRKRGRLDVKYEPY